MLLTCTIRKAEILFPTRTKCGNYSRFNRIDRFRKEAPGITSHEQAPVDVTDSNFYPVHYEERRDENLCKILNDLYTDQPARSLWRTCHPGAGCRRPGNGTHRGRTVGEGTGSWTLYT